MKKRSRSSVAAGAQQITSAEVDALLTSGRKLTRHEVKQIGGHLKMEDIVEKAEEAKVVPDWLKRQRERDAKELLRRLGKLKRGQVYVLRWPKLGWENGFPVNFGRNKAQAKARWEEFVKANPAKLYHWSGCLPDEAGRGPGMMYEIVKMYAYDLHEVTCGGCGGDLEAKGQDREQAREKAKAKRVRKPTKPRDLLSVAQVVKRMAEEAKRIDRLAKGKKER